MTEQPLDLKGFVKAVWRSRLLVGALVLAGLACGVAHTELLPALPTARTLVVIPPTAITNTGGAPVDDTPTQIIIATSTPVLAAAGAAVSPPISPTALRSHVVVTALSPGVLQFQVTAPGAYEAEKLANAQATDYIAYVNKTTAQASGGAIPGLQKQSSALATQIQKLQDQINSVSDRLAGENGTSSAGERDSSLLSSLRNEQGEVSLQLNNINSEIVSTQLSGTLSANATRVLQPAAIVPLSTLQLALSPIVGAVAGLFAGCLIVLLRSRRDQRLRYRDELASAIGVPVLASVECSRCKSVKDWKRLLENYRPSTVDSWNLRRLLHRLVAGDGEQPVELNLVAFADDAPALAVGVQFARSAAELGIPAELVLGTHPLLAPMRAACALLGSPASSDEPYKFDAKNSGQDFSSVRLTLSVVAVDEVKPVVPTSEGASLLAVSSGFTNSEALARVALAISDGGQTIDGLVVVNPDPSDTTAGVVPVGGEPRPLANYNSHRPSGERSVGQPR